MAPFSDNFSIVKQHQTRIRANHRLERGFVGGAERIFRARHLNPTLDGLFRARREAVERDAVLLRVFVNQVDFAEIRVVGLFQMRRNEQNRVVRVAENLVGEVVADGG